MHPTIWGGVQSYTMCLIVAEAVGLVVAFACAHRAGVPWGRFALAIMLLTAAAFAGAKLCGLIERGGALGAWRAEMVSGYRHPGAVVAVAIAALLSPRVANAGLPAGQLLDLITPSFAFSLVVVRIGCLMAGCCAGMPSALPWAIAFPSGSQVWHAHLGAGLIAPNAPYSLPVHPLQLYFAGLSFALGVFALQQQRRTRCDGNVFLAFVAAYGTGQVLLEFVRARRLPHVQYLCGACAILGATILLARRLAPAPYRTTERHRGREAHA